MKKLLLFLACAFNLWQISAQDTFSIVAVDSVTGEVGSAGASCVDMDNFPQYQPDFLGELLPGLGAINTQSYYNETNQQNARLRMLASNTPQQIINWLVANDVNATPGNRQYGIAAIVNGKPQTAAYTGADCFDFKAHITGRNYAIQGNILSGKHVLDSMEARFLRENGDLACKLMAALQGANSVGADTRCATYGTSSLFAFVKVSLPTDSFNKPSFRLTVKARSSAPFEPIDSLQKIFNASKACKHIMSLSDQPFPELLGLYPNPANRFVHLKFEGLSNQLVEIKLFSISGQLVANYEQGASDLISLDGIDAGMYTIQIKCLGKVYRQKLIKFQD
jgi:uncharacterized Ntn-hydrolase superfamily protein